MKMQSKSKQTGNVIARCKPHWTSLLLPEILCFLLFWCVLASIYAFFTEEFNIALTMLITTLGFTVLDVCYIRARLKTDCLILTDTQIVGKTGIVHTKTMTTLLSQVQSVSISNGLFGKILGYHTVIISCAGIGIGEYIFSHMAGAEEFVAQVNSSL